MKKRFGVVYCFSLILGIVLLTYGSASAQDVTDIVDKAKDVTKDAAEKTVDTTKDVADTTGDVAVDAAKKTVDVTEDGVDAVDGPVVGAGKATVEGAKKGYDKADDVAADTGEVTVKGAKKAVGAGEYVTVTAWDGTKWVSKKIKKGTLKGVQKTVEGFTIIGEEVTEILD